MSGMLETLALRGAGLAPADGRPVLVPRPRHRFEPGPGALAPGDMTIGYEEARGEGMPSPPPSVGHSDPSARPDEPSAAPRSITPALEPSPTVVPRNAARRTEPGVPELSEESRPGRPTTDGRPTTREAAEPSRTLPPEVGSEAGARGRAESELPADPAIEIPKRHLPSPRAQPRVEGARIEAAAQAPAPDPPSSAPSEDRAPSPARVIAAVEQRRHEPAIERIRRPEPAPQVTVSIGRIEVELARPEPARPAPRPQIERSRGFEGYARARRGQPR